MPHVMVVEDEPITAADLEQKLADMGHEVSWFDSGEEALGCASALLPDLVLMDIRLRGEINGIEAARRLRESQDVPIVFITAFSDPATVDGACDVQPHGYLLKPFTERSVATTVQAALARAHGERTRLERERWITQAMQYAGDAVIAVDGSAAIRFINARAERLLGVVAQDVLGADARSVVRFAGEEGAIHPLEAALRAGCSSSASARTVLCGTPESKRVIAYSAAPVYTNKRVTAGAVLTFREADPGLASNGPTPLVALDELSRRLAHEINNPLTYNLGALGLAQRELAQLRATTSRHGDEEHPPSQPPAQQLTRIGEYLQSAEEGANRVARVVRELKMFSLSEREREPVQPGELLELAIESTKLNDAPHIRWVRCVEAAPIVHGSKLQLASVLAYAVRNAVEALERRGAGAITVVTAATTDARGRAELRVTARGAAPADAASDATVAARTTTVSRKLAEQIVETHAGELVVTEAADERAFALYLPALESAHAKQPTEEA